MFSFRVTFRFGAARWVRRIVLAAMLCAFGSMQAAVWAADKPNIILAMADDLGWGDTGFNGHPILKTPNLDKMAENGIRFDRFYAGSSVCSPTRGSCLTGRHPYRYGVFYANQGHMRAPESTMAEALARQGYATGHFGKWHLGTLTKTVRESNRGGDPKNEEHYAPPWDNGFQVSFSTEAKVPTWDPMKSPESDEPYGTHYWNHDGTMETENLEGDDSRVIMDRAIPFIRRAVEEETPFFAVIWFHTPHLPVVAGAEYRKPYADQPEKEQHYYGAVTAMDEQIGRLRKELGSLGVAENTMLWFCSDNGPEGKAGGAPGTAAHLRGRKRSFYEGGIRVPGLLEWPARITTPRVVDMPCSTSDYYPTVMEVLGFQPPGQPTPIDGLSLLPLIEGRMNRRPAPIAFEGRDNVALIANQYKLIRPGLDKPYELYDIAADPGETADIAADQPDVLREMRETVELWQASCKDSLAGKDYK